MRMGGKKMLISKKFFYCPAFSGGCPASSGGSSPRFYGQGCRFFCRRRGTFVTPVRVPAGESERSGCALRAVCVWIGAAAFRAAVFRATQVSPQRCVCCIAAAGVGCAMRWGVRVDWERRCSKRRCSGRHKCRPYGASVALRRLGRGQKNGNRLARSGSRCVG